MVKFRKIAFLTMAAVLLSTCATGISNLSESRVGGQVHGVRCGGSG